MLVVGITGTLGAGKGTVVDYLVSKCGFTHYSVREFLISEIKQRGLSVDRDSMVIVANDLRAKHGASYITDKLFEQAVKNGKNAVIESLRAEGEIISLRNKVQLPNRFLLLSVDAPAENRFERIKERNTETDRIDFETFISNEKREMQNTDSSKQNLQRCMQLADVNLNNAGSIEDLYKHIESQVMPSLSKDAPTKRPNWDEYFMEMCHSVAKRATCNRGKSGCVIVKDKQILVTGYVGSPSHLPHCDDQGHLFKKTLHEDGHVSTHCVRTVHAEQNAICQAAKRGIALENAVLYCTMTPCRTCAMLIINCGIKDVVCEYRYHSGEESEEMFKQAGINLRYFNNSVLQYEKQ